MKASIGGERQGLGNGRCLDWLEGPPLAVFLGDGAGLVHRFHLRCLRLGPGGTHGDPLTERIELLLRKLPVGRHLMIAVLVGDEF